MSIFETITESALAGKNVVIKTPPGIGTVSKTLATLEAAGFSIAQVEARVGSPAELGLLFLENDSLRWQLPDEIVTADLLVFDGIESAVPEMLNALNELITKRVINGVELPSVKSVVAIRVSDDTDTVTEFESLDNTVTVTVR
jgi:hypothetical protein